MSLNSTEIVFLSRSEYFAEITNTISRSKKGDYIALATMNFQTENSCAELIEALKNSSKNGAQVSLLYDSYNYLTNKYSMPGPLFWNTELPKNPKLNPWKTLYKTVQQLENIGVKTTLTNIPQKIFTLPFAGRSHIKFCVINETVYIGGCNLSSSSDIDIMLKITNSKLANQIKNLNKKIQSYKNVSVALNNKDVIYKISPDIELIIDAGVKKQSLIFDNALELIDGAKEYIFMTCQFFPNSATIKKLQDAYNRGVKIELFYNNPSKQPFPKNLLHYLVRTYYKFLLPADFFNNELPKNNLYIHSKILLNEKTCLIGSHNYVKAGVSFGTAEICLKVNNPKNNHSVISCIKKQLNDNSKNIRSKRIF